MSGDDEFNWSYQNRDVIVPEQKMVAIYTNNFGQAVIRVQKDWPDESEDPFIIIDHAHLPDVIARLREIADAPVQRTPPG